MRARPSDGLTFSPDGTAAKFYYDASTGKFIARNADNTGWVYPATGAAYDFQNGQLRTDYPDNQMFTLLLLGV